MTTTKQQTGHPSHYVGVGASAGGLEALQEFFGGLPNDTGAAFVIVQHLSPDFKSMMPELLSKHTSMPICQVTDAIEVHSNCVYLMPPRKNMLMAEGKLLLSEQMPDSHLHMPIDTFLRSLAEDQQHRAIGIVLSGTGSDGTKGIKALKESGGLVIVQDPASAKFDGMPISAHNAGLTDMLLLPAEMGANLVSFISHPFISGTDSPLKYSIDDNDQTLVEIFRLLEKQSSINFSQYKASTVARRIERRLGINQLTSLDAYLRLLMESPRELQILSKELLIGVTRFFRDDEPFATIADSVIPELTAKAGDGGEIRFWIAGCSTGEEAYSLAILLDEAIGYRKLDCRVKIFATDVDEQSIAEASSGVYSADVVHDVSAQRLEKYFEIRDQRYVVSKRLRQMVIFATHNMIEDPPFSNIDMVSCRNALIYFQHSAQKRVLSSLYFALRTEGILFLGSSESLGDLQSHFETIDERARIYRKISNVRVPIGHSPPLRTNLQAGRVGGAMAPVPAAMKPGRLLAAGQLSGVVERLIREYSPDCIVLNDLFDAIHVYGDVSQYTKGITAGRISNNIKDMVVDELSVAVSTGLHRCERSEEDVLYKGVALSFSDTEKVYIDLSILYVRESDLPNAPHYYVVQFIKYTDEIKPVKVASGIAFDATEQSQQRIRDLEQELMKKQEHLQVTIEELETTNEELQSANEELMSANEELQSTNEELQSVNEELYTVNSEYQEKIIQLTAANDDLDSVISAADIGIIFLDEHLTIRRYTPGAAVYINLRRGDIGRPFHHISHDLLYDDFLTDIAMVSSGGSKSIEKDIMSRNDHALLVRIVSYQADAAEVRADVLITITNISRLRFVENALHRAQEQLRSSLLNRTDRQSRRGLKHSSLKVLLLDDDSFDRKFIEKLLTTVENRSFDVIPCSEIDEAVDIAGRTPVDICLVDYRLSAGTAKDFTQKLHSQNIELPIVILSAYSEKGLDTEFLTTDVFDFLNKEELSSQLLVRSIDYAIDRKGLQNVLEDSDV
ncbi:response regulator [Exilibacterium tricleocarpae]|uniref:protein-glutamate O-methyltransferase n=1 Tax=Exilibacterium tricleocarpae TaxID=2591008 RepID=A0A545T852_9GAMM|nr:chemotaxis protein CheB [Exilibacterium tricleocarpae]TQV73390.1 response regulator [Exilibacterium tricleocarpae]